MPTPEFRVWDGDEMIYISDSPLWSLKITASAEWMLYHKGRIHCRTSAETGLMQYLGIKDDEGQKIFDGDILRSDTGTHGVVWWNPEKGRYYLLSPAGDTVGLARETITWDGWQVVGNVHEDPEIMDPVIGQLRRRLNEHVEEFTCPVCGGTDFVAKRAPFPSVSDTSTPPLAVDCTRCHHVLLFHKDILP